MLFEILLAILLLIHGMIHVLGYNRLKATSAPAPRYGFLWYFTAVLLLTSVLLLLVHITFWWMTGCLAILLSQLLILWNWQLAKWGTIMNSLLLVAICWLLLT